MSLSEQDRFALQIPGAAMNTVKRNYYQKDLLDWCSYAGVEIKWPDTFPLRSVLPLRVTLAASCDPDLIARICESLKTFINTKLHSGIQTVQHGEKTRTLVTLKVCMYSETSDKGHSERGQTSQQRTCQKYLRIHTL